MRKRVAVLAMLCSATASVVLADGIIYDGFNYSAAGSKPFLGSGPNNSASTFGKWVFQGNNTTEPNVKTGNLSYTGLPASFGNSIQLDQNNGGATGADAARLYVGTIDKSTVPTLYYSFITSLPSSTNASQNGAYYAGFDNLTAASAYTTFAGLFIRQDAGSTSDLNLGMSTSGSVNKGWTSVLPHDTPLLVVASFTFQGLSNLDVFTDPAAIPFTEPGTHSATSTGVDASTVTQISNFYLRGNSGEPQGIKVDELRIGTTWADVASHNYFWDTDGATPGPGGATPSGNWDGTAPNFNTDATGGSAGALVSTTAAFDAVTFSAAGDATGNYTVTVSGTQAAGNVNIKNGNVTLDGGTLKVGAFDVATGLIGTVSSTMAGGPTGVSKTGAGTLILTGSATYTGATTLSGGALVVGNDASAPILTSPGGANVKSGTQLIFDYTGGSTPVALVRAGLQSGFATGFVTGQIRSSTATPAIGLGYSDDGVSRVIVKAAYYGDANLDGTVDSADFTSLATDFNSTNGSWAGGDFNYDGMVNALDFNSLSINYGQTIAAPALGSLVPEPTSLLLLALLCIRSRTGRTRRQAIGP